MKSSEASHDVDGGPHSVQNDRDITAEEAAEWVSEEFLALDCIHAIEARIRIETDIIGANAHKAGAFPMTQFAHETLLAELRAEYARQAIAMVSTPRTLH